MTARRTLSRCWRLSLVFLAAVAILQSLILALAPTSGLNSKPLQPRAEPPHAPDLTPFYAEVIPAKNPVRLSLEHDGHKVLGWISGSLDLAGRIVIIQAAAGEPEKIKVQPGNTFTWDYKFLAKTAVSFSIDIENQKALKETLTVIPAVAEKEPSVFFIVDRTAYRPTQSLRFAGFLRRLNAQSDFEPLANTEVEVELVSQQQKTKIFKARLRSDDLGKIAGSYTFMEADPLDTYTLRIANCKGEAKLLLGEYRKSKNRLRISGEAKNGKLPLQFETIDYLGKAVPVSKLSFKLQVIQKKKTESSHALKAEEFAYYAPLKSAFFDPDELADDDRLLWLSDDARPPFPLEESRIVAEFKNDFTLNGVDPVRSTVDLKREWELNNFSIVVEAVVTDANGREERGTYAVSLSNPNSVGKAKLELAKEIFAANEKIVVRLSTQDGKPVDGITSLVVMKLAAAPENRFNVPVFNGQLGQWNLPPVQEKARRTLVHAVPFRNDSATVVLTEPGAYKFVAVTEHDGRSTQVEIGCQVKPNRQLKPIALQLQSEEMNSGDHLKGAICSRFANARVLLTVRESSGLRFWKPMTLDNRGLALLDEKLPGDLKYGVTVEVQYVDALDVKHSVNRFVRINPTDRIVNVTVNTKETVKPGEVVKIDLQADRKEEIDLVVSVYDKALLGVNPDKSVDIRNFYLADERVRQMQAERWRQRLGDVTVGTLLKRAEAILANKAWTEGLDADRMKQLWDAVYSRGTIDSKQVIELLRLAGYDARLNPAWHGNLELGWKCRVYSGERLRDVLASNTGFYTLVIDVSGDMLLIHEMRPDWANLDPRRAGAFNPYAGMMGMSGGMMGMSGGMMGMAGGMMGMVGVGGAPAQGQPLQLINADANPKPIEIRRDFSDSAYWNANVRTDKEGNAQVEFKVPDSLTDWQVVVAAVSKKMHVGQGKSNFRTFAPVMIVPMLPRSFTEGDIVKLFGTVRNYTGKAQAIAVGLKVENGEILTGADKKIKVEANASANVYWTVRAGSFGDIQLSMTADCEGGFDAVLKRLPVVRASAEQIITKSGVVKPGDVTFAIPKEVDLASSRLEISLAPTLAADMADTLNYLVEYPYGCVEQTMSRFLPAIKVAQILKQYHVDHPELNQKLPGCVAGGIKRLLELQQPDGGWGWHYGSATHEMMTPYALYGLLQAEKAGYAIPNEIAVSRGLQRLKAFIDNMNDSQAADRIYCLYVWSHREKLDLPQWEFLARMERSGRLSDYANALCLMMCVEQDRMELARRFAHDLRARASKVNDQVYWTTAGFSRWADDPHEVTAAAMKALVAFDPNDPLIGGILSYFAATKRGNHWNSTKDTALILFAMCDYLAKTQFNPDAKNELALTTNGGEARNFKFEDGLSKKLTIAGEKLKNGDNTLTFKTEMTGVMYRAVLRYWKNGGDAATLNEGIAVERKFYLWDEKNKRIGEELKDGATIARGSYLICDTAAASNLPGNMKFMLMECPKPATAEIIPIDDVRFQDLQLKTGYALREQRLSSVAFHHETAPQTVKNRVIMLAELAGEYTVPPAFAELMYRTEIRGHSGTLRLKVADDK